MSRLGRLLHPDSKQSAVLPGSFRLFLSAAFPSLPLSLSPLLHRFLPFSHAELLLTATSSFQFAESLQRREERRFRSSEAAEPPAANDSGRREHLAALCDLDFQLLRGPEGRSASTRPQTGSGEPEIGSLAQNITTNFWLFSAWKGLNVKLPVWVYRSWRYPAWSVWFIHLRHKTFDLYWVFTFYHIKSCRWNPVRHFKVEMQRSDINICIRPDIEYNSRSGIGDNVPNP